MFRISLRRAIMFREIVSYHIQPKIHSLSLSTLWANLNGTEAARDSKKESTSSCYDHRFPHFPLSPKIGNQSNDFKIDIVDDETWQASTGFADAIKDATAPSQVTQVVNYTPRNSNDPDFDEIDDLRICGNLFYKLDRASKEYEEYSYDFHRRKSSKKKGDWKESNTKETPPSDLKRKDEMRESKAKGNPRINSVEGSFMGDKQKQRVPTFNQVTAAYHEPFCLDVYISKASVRACIVHRATSKVVVVAHSISKDMKFDLGSTKNVSACGAVGKVLAQRALADDIHNIVYTPRKGEKLEGKLQSVVESVISNGVRVKVKIKKKNVGKPGFKSADSYKYN